MAVASRKILKVRMSNFSRVVDWYCRTPGFESRRLYGTYLLNEIAMAFLSSGKELFSDSRHPCIGFYAIQAEKRTARLSHLMKRAVLWGAWGSHCWGESRPA
jgi:hypothetical protein